MMPINRDYFSNRVDIKSILCIDYVYIYVNIIFVQTEAEDAIINKKRSKKTAKKYISRQRLSKVEAALEEQFHTGRLLGNILQ